MNGLEIAERIQDLSRKASALCVICEYMSDDRDFSDEVYILGELQAEIEREQTELEAKLRSVNI